MPKNMRVFVIVLSIIAIGLSGFSLAIYSQKRSCQKRLEEAKVAQRDLEKRLQKEQEAGVGLRNKLTALAEKINTLTRQLEQQKQTSREGADLLSKKDLEMKALELSIHAERVANVDLQKQIQAAGAESVKIQARAEHLMIVNKDLEQKIKKLGEQGSIFLGTVVVRQGFAEVRN